MSHWADSWTHHHNNRSSPSRVTQRPPAESSGWLASCQAHLSAHRVVRFPGGPGNGKAFHARLTTAAGQSVKASALHRCWKAERSCAMPGESRSTSLHTCAHNLLLYLLQLLPSLPQLTNKQLYISWYLSSTLLPPHCPCSRRFCRDFKDFIFTILPYSDFLLSFITCELNWGLNVHWENSMGLNHGCFAGSIKQWNQFFLFVCFFYYMVDHQSGACFFIQRLLTPYWFMCVSPRLWIDT